MAEAAEMETRLARIEAALAAAEAALADAAPPEDLRPELDALRVELDEARRRAEAAEAERDAAVTRAEEAEAKAVEAPDGPRAATTHAPAVDGGEEGQRLRAAVEALAATSEQLRAQQDGAVDAALAAELEALRAARAMDLAEMRALLAELEPMLGEGTKGNDDA